MNSKTQSNVGLGQAIAYFTGLGYSVSIPLTESQRYDIVVDDGEKLYRVEVKTTRAEDSEISLRTFGRSVEKTKKISTDDCDLVFCYSLTTQHYFLFPSLMLEGRTSINLCDKYKAYAVHGRE